MNRLVLLSSLALLAGGAFGCGKKDVAPSPSPSSSSTPLLAEVSACAAVVETPASSRSPACVLPDDRTVRVFIPGATATARAVAVAAVDGGAAIDLTLVRAVTGGELFTMKVPANAVTVELRRATASTTLAFSTESSPRPSWYAGAQALRKNGKLEEVEAMARPSLSNAAAPLTERAAAEGILARVALRQGKIDDAIHLFEAAIKDDQEAGLLSDRADDAFALTFVLHKRTRRYADARRVLDEAKAALTKHPYYDGLAREPLYRAQVAWETGDTRTATRELATSIERADRLGAESIARAARQVRAMVSCTAGNTRSCVESLREADREIQRASAGADAPPCEHAEVLISLGFAELEEAELGPSKVSAGAGVADERALKILETTCPDPYMQAVALEHLAMTSVLNANPAEAKKRLAQAKTLAKEPRVSDAIMWLDIEGNIADLEKHPESAIASFDAARNLARASAQRTQEWHALVGKGRVLASMSRFPDALSAFRDAEGVLDDVVAMVPFGEGRASAAVDGSASVHRAVNILVDALKKPNDAARMIRHARARLVRSLSTMARVDALSGPDREKWERAVASFHEARAEIDKDAEGDWKKSKPALDAALTLRATKLSALRSTLDDAMAALGRDKQEREKATAEAPADETVLTFTEIEPGVVLVFVTEPSADASSHTRAYRVQGSASVLEPASEEIRRAKRLRIFTDDKLAAIDFHALTVGGGKQRLIEFAPVVYGLDLAAASSSSTTNVGGGGHQSLVVADPTGDLPSARKEGEAVTKLLLSSSTTTLTGRDATASRVREALLRTSSTFHYAGHGRFQGVEGAESTLPLAEGGALTLGDVLTLTHSPPDVVLSGCEAGKLQGKAGEPAFNMAQAFLIAGASIVIAPVRDVDDKASGAIATAIHAHFGADAGAATDIAEALRQAQLDAFRNPDHTVQVTAESFRAFVR